MRRWEAFQQYLDGLVADGYDSFTHGHVVSTWRAPGIGRVNGVEASKFIEAYKWEALLADSQTKYILRREGRTRATVWHIRPNSAAARAVGVQFRDDMANHINVYVSPLLTRIGADAPRALPAAQAIAKGIEASVDLLASMLPNELVRA